ncbi:maleylpyruvate isomerase family mycothiol-dependent enzyme [Nocardia sp. NPDC006630]|uniref:maleylpyruvate isomerase family mycothiol-dependent enzyme n=1 Tax=Nocardia sp. NPDC006630 TaxID=3157181 RepID=UPI0033BB10C9
MITTPDEIWRAVSAERTTLVELLEKLPETEWDHASLCAGWRVRDVVAHVVLSSRPTVLSLLANLIRARGSIPRLNLDSAIRYADATSSRQLLTDLRAVVPMRRTPPGTTPDDRLMDVLVHIQDIALPLGLEYEMSTASARLALERVWRTRWLFRAQERFSGFRLTATDTTWTAGTGPAVEGTVADLLLLVAGRDARLSALTGEGAGMLPERSLRTLG